MLRSIWTDLLITPPALKTFSRNRCQAELNLEVAHRNSARRPRYLRTTAHRLQWRDRPDAEHVLRTMIKVADIHAWLESKAGHALHKDEGVMFGDVSREITGATVCWMPSPENMRLAAAAGHELLIHHEALLYPYPFEHIQPLNAIHWFTNTQRLTTLGETNLISTR